MLRLTVAAVLLLALTGCRVTAGSTRTDTLPANSENAKALAELRAAAPRYATLMPDMRLETFTKSEHDSWIGRSDGPTDGRPTLGPRLRP